MPQPVMLKKLKLNSSMKTYKTFETNIQKICPFHYRGLEYKSKKSRNTWSNRQIWSWSTKWSRPKANRVLQRELTGQRKHTFPTTQEKLYTRTSPDGQYIVRLIIFLQPKMEKLYTVNKSKTGSWLWLRSWTPYCQIQTSIKESRENH